MGRSRAHSVGQARRHFFRVALSGRKRMHNADENIACNIKYLIRGGERWIRTRGISRRIAYRAVRDSRTTKIGHSDFGPGDGSALDAEPFRIAERPASIRSPWLTD